MRRLSWIVAALAALSLTLLAPVAAYAAPKTVVLAWSPSGNYHFGSLTSGTKSETFTLTNTGGQATGKLTVGLSGAAFTKTADSCTRTSLRQGEQCTVTVQYAFSAAGQTDNGALTATAGKKASATVGLTGMSVSSSPMLTFDAPAVSTGTPGAYEWYWGTGNYVGNNGGSVHYVPGYDEYLTLRNDGNSSIDITKTTMEQGSTAAGSIDGYSGGFLSCVGLTLRPGDTCTFNIGVAAATCVASADPGVYSTVIYRWYGRPADSPSAPETEYATLTAYGQFICWS